MNWSLFKDTIKHNYSQTYDIVLTNMNLSLWDGFLEYTRHKGYFVSYATTEDGFIENITAKEILKYFEHQNEFWPCIVLSIGGFRIDGFIKSSDFLELWFNDEKYKVLTEQAYNKIVEFILDLSKELKSEIKFVNSDAGGERIILKTKNGIIIL